MPKIYFGTPDRAMAEAYDLRIKGYVSLVASTKDKGWMVDYKLYTKNVPKQEALPSVHE